MIPDVGCNTLDNVVAVINAAAGRTNLHKPPLAFFALLLDDLRGESDSEPSGSDCVWGSAPATWIVLALAFLPVEVVDAVALGLFGIVEGPLNFSQCANGHLFPLLH